MQALVVKNLKAKRVLKMYVKEVLVQNKAGLHARPATFFIQKANEYKSTIWVEKEERRVNAKVFSVCCPSELSAALLLR